MPLLIPLAHPGPCCTVPGSALCAEVYQGGYVARAGGYPWVYNLGGIPAICLPSWVSLLLTSGWVSLLYVPGCPSRLTSGEYPIPR